jgi:hypothetical protein
VKAILRTLIVWLALLAVPFQGFASAAMLSCAPPPATAHHQAAAGHHGMQQATQSHHCDDGQAAQQKAKCSHCAACCVGTALVPSALSAIAPHSRITTAIPADAGPVPSVDLDHPERPPRFLRA